MDKKVLYKDEIRNFDKSRIENTIEKIFELGGEQVYKYEGIKKIDMVEKFCSSYIFPLFKKDKKTFDIKEILNTIEIGIERNKKDFPLIYKGLILYLNNKKGQ